MELDCSFCLDYLAFHISHLNELSCFTFKVFPLKIDQNARDVSQRSNSGQRSSFKYQNYQTN